MNKPFYLFLLFFVTCQSEPAENEIPEMEATVNSDVPDWENKSDESSDIIEGKWQMDSAIFINDGVDGTSEEPIIPTTWTFGSDNSYLVENNIQISGSYTLSKEDLETEVMGMKTEYEIIELNIRSMILRSTIYENDNGSMKSRAYLTKISD